MVTGLADGCTGVVVVVHHVVLDGVSALAVLAHLADGAGGADAVVRAARPVPTRRQLLADVVGERARGLRSGRSALGPS